MQVHNSINNECDDNADRGVDLLQKIDSFMPSALILLLDTFI